MSNDPKRDESGDRMLCDPWHGARTPEFRTFKRNLKAAADALFLHEDGLTASLSQSTRQNLSSAGTTSSPKDKTV